MQGSPEHCLRGWSTTQADPVTSLLQGVSLSLACVQHREMTVARTSVTSFLCGDPHNVADNHACSTGPMAETNDAALAATRVYPHAHLLTLSSLSQTESTETLTAQLLILSTLSSSCRQVALQM